MARRDQAINAPRIGALYTRLAGKRSGPMSKRRASCSCGQLSVICEGEPVRISMCHCLACQQRTGSVFSVQARFSRSQVQVEGRATQYLRTSDSGNRTSLYFCPVCGSTVYWEPEAL